MDQRVLRWFGHIERKDEYPMAGRVLVNCGSKKRAVWGRKGLGLTDGMKVKAEPSPGGGV